MKAFKILFFILIISKTIFAQSSDSTKNISSFSGSVGFTNNGFSIIPTFSLNHSAFVANLSFKKKKFSFEPDIRLVPDAKNGGMLWWLRYQLVDNKKFGFRIGTHPAFTLIKRTDIEDGTSKEITEMLRFIAFEAVPSYQFNKNFGVSAMYLQGNGLQNHGPQLTRVLFLNSNSIVLYQYNADGSEEPVFTKYFDFENKIEIMDMIQDENDQGIVVLGRIYLTGRYLRPIVIKFKKDDFLN